MEKGYTDMLNRLVCLFIDRQRHAQNTVTHTDTYTHTGAQRSTKSALLQSSVLVWVFFFFYRYSLESFFFLKTSLFIFFAM